MPYKTADYIKNIIFYKKYYDEIYICEKSSKSHYKSAIKLRNREMIDRSEFVICYIEREHGGAYEAFRYAQSHGKQIINLAPDED